MILNRADDGTTLIKRVSTLSSIDTHINQILKYLVRHFLCDPVRNYFRDNSC